MARYVCWLNPNFKMTTLVFINLIEGKQKNRKNKQTKNMIYLCLPVKSIFVVKDLNLSHSHVSLTLTFASVLLLLWVLLLLLLF